MMTLRRAAYLVSYFSTRYAHQFEILAGSALPPLCTSFPPYCLRCLLNQAHRLRVQAFICQARHSRLDSFKLLSMYLIDKDQM
mmetsp:Transcript_52673/g.109912  ORF Transcript_52673/g.109912 Transcript_52673/m.109912 type:complete len:83 (+) Transcript_52673:98-346(+)